MPKLPSYSHSRLSVLFALIGALLVAGGAWLVYPPAGVIVAGFAFVLGAYVVRYLEVKSEAA